MKRTLLLFAAILALMLSGCRGDDTDHCLQSYKHKEVTITTLAGIYCGQEFSESYNYYILLTDNEYTYYFDLYADTPAVGTQFIQLPMGEFRYANNSKMLAGEFSQEYSYAAAPNDKTLYYSSGTITISYDSIEALLTLSDGTTHHLHYSGDTFFRNQSEPISTLTEDVTLDISGATIDVTRYDALGTGYEHYYFMLYEDSALKDGRLVIVELFYPRNNSLYNTFTANTNTNTNFGFYPGYIAEGVMRGAWYVELADGLPTETIAPISSGWIKVAQEEEALSFEFDCLDDAGHKITGTIRE